MASSSLGMDPASVLPLAAAIELIHTYSLIHDDLPAMDDDDLRRGQPTCHKKFGEALAILAGDALLTLAFQVMADDLAPAVAAACCRELAVGAGMAGMVGGQVDDLAWERAELGTGSAERGTEESSEFRAPSSELVAGLEHLHARKTGALVRASLKLVSTKGLISSRRSGIP